MGARRGGRACVHRLVAWGLPLPLFVSLLPAPAPLPGSSALHFVTRPPSLPPSLPPSPLARFSQSPSPPSARPLLPCVLCCAGAEIGVASTKAYTSQIVAITMMSLVLSEDAISKRQRRDEIIDSLCNLPGEARGCWRGGAGRGWGLGLAALCCAVCPPCVEGAEQRCWGLAELVVSVVELDAAVSGGRPGPLMPAPADMVRRTLKLNDQIKQLAADLKDEQSCLMFGRGRNYATAMEAALKVGGWVGGWRRLVAVTKGWTGLGCLRRLLRLLLFLISMVVLLLRLHFSAALHPPSRPTPHPLCRSRRCRTCTARASTRGR